MIERGQIYWCRLDPVQGHEQGFTRPVVIVSSDAYNQSRSPLVGVVPLTKSPVKNPIHVRLAAEETGLELDSTALTDHARFVDRARLTGEVIGRVEAGAVVRLDRQMVRVFGL